MTGRLTCIWTTIYGVIDWINNLHVIINNPKETMCLTFSRQTRELQVLTPWGNGTSQGMSCAWCQPQQENQAELASGQSRRSQRVCDISWADIKTIVLEKVEGTSHSQPPANCAFWDKWTLTCNPSVRGQTAKVPCGIGVELGQLWKLTRCIRMRVPLKSKSGRNAFKDLNTHWKRQFMFHSCLLSEFN